jgi:hypothetical protein
LEDPFKDHRGNEEPLKDPVMIARILMVDNAGAFVLFKKIHIIKPYQPMTTDYLDRLIGLL